MTAWHPPPDALTRYTGDPDAVDAVTAASIETHLVGCLTCRAALAAHWDRARLDRSWDAVADRLDRPAIGRPARLLERVGVPETWASLVTATWPLQATALVAASAVLATAVMLARIETWSAAVLVIAPVAPLATVAVTFASGRDPAGPILPSTPMAGVGLLLRRSAVILPLAMAAVALAQWAAGWSGPVWPWLAPSVVLVLAALALGSWLSAELASITVGISWAALVALWRVRASASVPLEQLPLFQPAARPAWVCAGLACLVVVVARRHQLAGQT